MVKQDVYEVRKVQKAHDITVEVVGSKSITNRALLLSALSQEKCTLSGVLFSDDSRCFMQALIDLGFEVVIDEPNKTVTIVGLGGAIPCCGIRSKEDCVKEIDATVYVGSAGTAARFLTAFLGLSKGRYRMTSSEQMKKRPMKELLVALEEMGSKIIYEEEPYHFPFIIGEFSCKKKSITVDIDKSSQFLSALLISSVLLPDGFQIQVSGNHGFAYVDMTVSMMKSFGVSMDVEEKCSYTCISNTGYQAQIYPIEPDLSAACYFYAMSPLLGVNALVKGVHSNSLQGDLQFLKVLEEMGCFLNEEEDGIIVNPPKDGLKGGVFDLSTFSDQALTLAALAPFTKEPVEIRNISHIRYQECDRIHAIIKNLSSMGIRTEEVEDGVKIYPGIPKSCEIETFDDHRVAMAFTLPGLVTGNMKILNPSCTKKTFENYFDVLENSVYK